MVNIEQFVFIKSELNKKKYDLLNIFRSIYIYIYTYIKLYN